MPAIIVSADSNPADCRVRYVVLDNYKGLCRAVGKFVLFLGYPVFFRVESFRVPAFSQGAMCVSTASLADQ